jgi:predicted GTPase
MTTPGLAHAIDFGTSTSTIVVVRPDGTTVSVPDPHRPLDGEVSIPTSVCADFDGTILVGTAAEYARAANPDGYRGEFKRRFGRPGVLPAGPASATADGLTGHILRFLREQALTVVPGEPERVVITIPVSWEASNRALMRETAIRAGYRDAVIGLEPEPVAALAEAFGDSSSVVTSPLTVLVYDLGGGTFDCAVARGTASRFDVLGAPGGIDNLGGIDFDSLLLGLLAQKLGPAIKVMLDSGSADVDADLLSRRLTLFDEAERIKRRLSTQSAHDAVLTAMRPPASVRVERAEFEDLIRPQLAETITECERMLSRLGMTWADIDRVVPVGGSSRIPLVSRMLTAGSGRAVLHLDNPDRAVVNGAARIARALHDGSRITTYQERETMTDAAIEDDQDDEAAAQEFLALLKKHADRLPTQRKPNILVCGGTGSGKTTSINTLFGREVGNVGYFTRGTDHDELYEWESQGQNIDVVDLPGLGDTKKRDREYREIYRRRVEQADGFIVVVAGPRPASEATLSCVKVLLSCGVEPERIVFAYNKLSALMVPVRGRMHQVALDGLAGPASKVDEQIIEEARRAFNADIRQEIHGGKLANRFPLDRVIAYDAFSGWNLFPVLGAVLETLPGDALVKWRDAVARAAADLQQRTENRIKKQTAEHRREMGKLERANKRLADRVKELGDEKKAAGKASADEQESQREKLERERLALEAEQRRLAEEREQLKREQRAAQSISYQLQAHDKTVAERFVEYAAPIVQATYEVARSAVNAVKSGWRKLFG